MRDGDLAGPPQPPVGFGGRLRPSSPSRDVLIYQNIYSDEVQDLLDPAFEPHDGRRNANTHYRELGLFMRLYHSGRHLQAQYTGIVSPKFREKAWIEGKEFIAFIRRNPGYDVYFINPFPRNVYYSFNVWQHGELCHPGLIPLAQNLFEEAGIDYDLARMGRNSHDTLSYSNYWAGNEEFWDRFMGLNLRLVQALERMPPHVQSRYFHLDPRYPDPVPVAVFIFERMLSTLLLMDRDIKALPYRYSRGRILEMSAPDRIEGPLTAAFIDVIDEIDRRGEYTPRDMAMFRALQRLRARL